MTAGVFPEVRSTDLKQEPHIIGIGIESMLIVLRSVERISGKTPAVINDYLIAGNQAGNERAEGLSRTAGPWDQEEDRPGATHFIRELSTRNGECTHVLSFLSIGDGNLGRAVFTF